MAGYEYGTPCESAIEACKRLNMLSDKPSCHQKDLHVDTRQQELKKSLTEIEGICFELKKDRTIGEMERALFEINKITITVINKRIEDLLQPKEETDAK